MFTDKELRRLDKILDHNKDYDEIIRTLLDIDKHEIKTCPECGVKPHSSWFHIIADASTFCEKCGYSTEYYNLHNKKYSDAINTYRSIRSSIRDWNSRKIYKED